MSFVHLHVHTEYTFFRSTCTVGALFRKADKLGMPAVAITDFNTLAGVPSFLRAAESFPDIKPIIGCEVMVETGNRTGRLILWAKNLTGYRNLAKIIFRTYGDGVAVRQMAYVSREELLPWREGIICCLACHDGEISQYIKKGDDAAAGEAVLWYRKTFGEDFYLEVTKTQKEGDDHLCGEIIRLAGRHGIKVIASNRVHFLNKEDTGTHKKLISTISSSKKECYTGKEYFKSERQMRAVFQDDPELVDNTLEVAGKIERYDICQKMELPEFPFQEEESSRISMKNYMPIVAAGACGEDGQLRDDSYFNGVTFLCHLVFRAAKTIYGKVLPADVKSRIETELKIIASMNLSHLFLIVWDLVHWARKEGIVIGSDRGRSAGSMVLYCLGVTSTDPIRYGLLFERFMSPKLNYISEINIITSDKHRMVEYLSDKYGRERVGYVLKYKVFTPSHPRYDKSLKGLVCGGEVHPHRIIIGRKSLCEYLPLSSCTYSVDGRQYPLSQYTAKECRQMGVLSLNIVRQLDLSGIKECVRLIRKKRRKHFDMQAIPTDDPDTFAFMASGGMEAIFEDKTTEANVVYRKLKPTCLEEMMMAEALRQENGLVRLPKLYARLQGRRMPGTGFPEVDEILKETHGVPVYREQVMRISQVVAGFTPDQADALVMLLEEAPGAALLRIYRHFFDRGRKERGYSEDSLIAIWDLFYPVRHLLYGRTSAASDALMIYRHAWLKLHYPKEYEEVFPSKENQKTGG